LRKHKHSYFHSLPNNFPCNCLNNPSRILLGNLRYTRPGNLRYTRPDNYHHSHPSNRPYRNFYNPQNNHFHM